VKTTGAIEVVGTPWLSTYTRDRVRTPEVARLVGGNEGGGGGGGGEKGDRERQELWQR